MRRRHETERGPLDELSDLLAELPMTGLQRHWADEWLRAARVDSLSRAEREELEELRDEVDDLQCRVSRASDILAW
jgi:hypothetical protein